MTRGGARDYIRESSSLPSMPRSLYLNVWTRSIEVEGCLATITFPSVLPPARYKKLCFRSQHHYPYAGMLLQLL